MVQTTIQRYKERQHPSNRQSGKEMLINAVHGQLGKPESDEFDGLIDHLTDSLCSQTHQEPDYDTNIFHLRRYPLGNTARQVPPVGRNTSCCGSIADSRVDHR